MNRKQRRAAGKRAGGKSASQRRAATVATALRHYQAGRIGDAEAIYRRILAAEPRNFDALYLLGLLTYQLGRPEAARKLIETAITVNPHFAEAHYNLGNLWREDEPAKAEECYRAALAQDSDLVEAHFNLGALYREQGRMNDARVCFEQAIALRPGYAEAHRRLVEFKSFDDPKDPQILIMESALANPSIDNEQRTHLHFALAKAYEDLGDYEQAFDRFEAGNRLKRAGISYDPEHEEARAERILSTVNSDLIGAWAEAGHRSGLPVFIVGMPRSGTTLVEQILASHGEVFGAGEIEDMERLTRSLAGERNTSYPEVLEKFDAAAFERLGRSYVEGLRRRASNAARITDKMPGNFAHLGFIRLILPKAYIVHCTRDPVDTCFACYRQLFSGGQTFAYDLSELGHYYRLYRRVMGHWYQTMPNSILTVRYESLVHDPRAETERILQFCGLPWDEACREFHKTTRRVQTASAEQVRRPINSGYIGRSAPFRTRLGPLIDALGPLAQGELSWPPPPERPGTG